MEHETDGFVILRIHPTGPQAVAVFLTTIVPEHADPWVREAMALVAKDLRREARRLAGVHQARQN